MEIKELITDKLYVLLQLSRHEGCTSTKLGKKADVSHSYVAQITTELEEENLITKEKDGRSNKIRLTEKGEQAVNGLHEIIEAIS